MPTSKPAINLNSDEWTLLSEVAATIQLRLGNCFIWFGDEEPLENEFGKELNTNNSEIAYGVDGKCWGMASKTTKIARVAITEHV